MKQSYIICGKPGAGKGTVVEFLKERLDAIIFRPSDITRSVLNAFKIPETRENLSKLMSILRNEFTKDIYVYAALDLMAKNPDKVIIFDGIRKLHFIKKIQLNSPSLLIYIETEDTIRYHRIKDRGDKIGENAMNIDEFIKNELLESENENEDIRAIADITIENNTTKGDLYQKLTTLL